MKFSKLLTGLTLIWAASLWAAVDQNPISNGTTLGRNMTGSASEANFHNPALLGIERTPSGGLLIFPISDIGIGVWSDKLHISPFHKYWETDQISSITSDILYESFDLKGLSPLEVSQRLTKELKHGFNLYSGFSTSLLSFANKRVSFDITTHAGEQVHVPGAPLMILFSTTDGLKKGSTLDFSDQKQEGLWATDFSFQVGLPVQIPALNDFFKLRYSAGGIGLKYVMGHSILETETERGKITYNGDKNQLAVDALIKVRSAGLGINSDWKDIQSYNQGFPVNGHGIGVEIGGILYDEHGTMSVNVQNLGVIFWVNNVKQVTYEMKSNDLNLYDILNAYDSKKNFIDTDSLFNQSTDKISKNPKFEDANGFVTLLPLGLNIGYSYTWDYEKIEKQGLRFLADYTTVAANYEQQLTEGPGRSFIPRLSLGGEAGTMHGFIPLRLGFVLGGPEGIASAFGMGFNFRYVSLQGSYKAVGTPYLFPSRGFELAAGLNVNWGMSMDSDKDGIMDKIDKCPQVPEDKDGFQDDDGCPDYDNDNDGIPDSTDKCVNDPEDKDGFQDADGCPDFDNDNDGIADSVDKCPSDAEDKDNFKDTDGCPDYDNDGDGVADSLDKCPNLPEDIDMFEDKDGCPDFDNDKDGIADTVDNCINDPESFNGYKDQDGCPDTLLKPTEKETKVLNTKLRAINFKTASAELLPVSYASLDYIVSFLGQYPNLRYEIQGHTDSQGNDDYNLLLSAARAGAVRAYLLSKGVPDSSLIAIGYGKTRPVADNLSAEGRALNRRVEFKTIESNEEYTMLKNQEAIFRDRIRNAKIKGANY